MTWRYDQSPGSDVTLLALYESVVAAEEFDLAEQARDDAMWSEMRVLHATEINDERSEPARVAEPEFADQFDRPRMTQVVGLVEHLLGGRFIADA